MAIKKKKNTELNTEKKIVEAARKLFTRKGYDAVKTRDIAEEAGINIALLNYYFRSKEKLFELIMVENMQKFFHGFSAIVNDEKTNYTKKIELIVANYIDMLLQAPDAPLFVLNQAKINPERVAIRKIVFNSCFMKQVRAAIKAGKIKSIDEINLMLNIVGLSIFPCIARPMFQTGEGALTQEQFVALMQERKKLIPKWINTMLVVK